MGKEQYTLLLVQFTLIAALALLGVISAWIFKLIVHPKNVLTLLIPLLLPGFLWVGGQLKAPGGFELTISAATRTTVASVISANNNDR